MSDSGWHFAPSCAAVTSKQTQATNSSADSWKVRFLLLHTISFSLPLIYLRFATIWIIIPGMLLHALKFSARPLHIPPLRPFFTWPFHKTLNRPSQMGSTSRMVHQLRKKSRKVVPSQTNLSFPRICFQIQVRWIIWWASSRRRRLSWFLRWWLWGGWIFSSRGLLLVGVDHVNFSMTHGSLVIVS